MVWTAFWEDFNSGSYAILNRESTSISNRKITADLNKFAFSKPGEYPNIILGYSSLNFRFVQSRLKSVYFLYLLDSLIFHIRMSK